MLYHQEEVVEFTFRELQQVALEEDLYFQFYCRWGGYWTLASHENFQESMCLQNKKSSQHQ